MRDPVAGGDRPDPVGPREVRRALVHHEPGAEEQRTGDRPGAHHPAEVREPEQAVARSKVERVGEVLGGLDRESAVDVDRRLRLAGRARRVDQHVRRLGVGVGASASSTSRAPGRPADHQRSRPSARSELCRPTRPQPPDDDDALDRRRPLQRLVGDLLEVDLAAPPPEPVGRDEEPGAAVRQPRGDRRRSVAREDRRVDRPDDPEREHRDRRSPGASAGRSRRGRRPRRRCRRNICARPEDFGPELGVRETTHVTRLALPGERLAVGVARRPRPRVAASAQLNAPPIHQRAHSGPPLRSRTRLGDRCQSRPRSSAAAPQNHAGSATARVCSASRSGSRADRRKRAIRASARSSGVGRHAASGTSRPKIGARSLAMDAAYDRRGRGVRESQGRGDIRPGCAYAPCGAVSRTCSIGTGIIRTRPSWQRFARASTRWR